MLDVLKKEIELRNLDKPYVKLIIVDKKGSTPRGIGTTCFYSDGKIIGTIGGGRLEIEIIPFCERILNDEKPQLKEFVLDEDTDQMCGGRVTIYAEPHTSQNELYIFGGGNVGLALAKVMADTPLKIYVIEQRKELQDKNRYPNSVKLMPMPYLDAVSKINFSDKSTFICIMTYSHNIDEQILHQVIVKPYWYLGIIGSKRKAVKFFARLKENGIPEEKISTIHCPIGIDIVKGHSPAEIAISIAAEILSYV
ncbi:MAG: xanthine dehydrogenase accessory protein XdhC [Candidatus Cloacimonadota bacterium]|nr:MAG: xanthine dehydrogenase accessory protein XdhC [Candidatus Cloacimonadota bacterium]